MTILIQVAKNKENTEESMNSKVNFAPYPNNIEDLSIKRNKKIQSISRDKILRASEKINW